MGGSRGLATRLGPKQCGFVDAARRTETSHCVDALDLNEEKLGILRYASELQERRDWCTVFCRDDWEIEPIRDDQMRLFGRRFRFTDIVDAVFFTLRFS